MWIKSTRNTTNRWNLKSESKTAVELSVSAAKELPLGSLACMGEISGMMIFLSRVDVEFAGLVCWPELEMADTELRSLCIDWTMASTMDLRLWLKAS